MDNTRDARGSDLLATGFGTTVTMWFLGYLGRQPAAPWPAPLLLALMLAAILAGGWTAARLGGGGARAGLRTGLLASVLNLLILGSLLSADGAAVHPSALIWLPGSLLLGAGVGGLGGRLAEDHGAAFRRGALFGPQGLRGRAWDAAFALVACAATLLLLVAGGMVTAQQAGLAVVDWPNSFGSNMFLYPLARMTGGVFYEHSHRLIGSLVGLTTLVLGVQLWRTEDRPWVKRLAAAALVMVIVQGILGGLRVTGHFTMSQDAQITRPNLTLAVVHGVLGQLFFSTLVTLFCVTTPLWRQARTHVHAGAGLDHGLSRTLVIMVILQLVFGAVLRHVAHGLLVHITWAVVVAMTAVFMGLRARGEHAGVPVVPGLGTWLSWLVGLQLLLGVMALWGTSLTETSGGPHAVDVIFTTLHQTTGAIILAVAVMLMLWTRRLIRAAAPQPREEES
ncbi:MAG TPA: COX15/CtaA family protein [Candidatus Krumholzibacteria bacterium]|nr:COX15/CtaA family protein [Candidatus Krumholzibacteria bacterium]HRX51347.1 COX15/CtaA family protein [Candidatus Krumholzibacteria bacterium]